MPYHPTRILRRLAVPALALAVVAAPLVAPTASARPTGDAKGASVARVSGVEQRALAAVANARAFASRDASVRTAAAARSGSLTMALREVANTRTALSGQDRAAADALLRRPTGAGGDGIFLDYGPAEAPPLCDADICVHYVTSSDDAPSLADGDGDGRPEYIERVSSTLAEIHDDYLAAGYREPKPDAGRGGNDKIDVYVGNIGGGGVYGYCTSDQPEPDPTPSTYDRWAYCVLDDDYAEFPANTPVENLQVTAAHEYFHATQYAYDRYEDAWILEATAAWVEDEMYDSVDDNLQYLSRSQMRKPGTPLDTFNQNTGFHYGTWSFFRYLTEKYRTKQGRLPVLVLNMFKKMDGAAGGPDQYSWQAVNTVLKSKNSSGAAALGGYAVANRRPARAYSEGRANNYPIAPLLATRGVSKSRGTKVDVKLNHLTSSTARLVPRSIPGGWRLKLTFDLPPTSRGSVALVTTTLRSGKVSTQRVALSQNGDAVKRVPFSSGSVKHVEVTVVNASGRFTCFNSGPSSCSGTSLDNGQRMIWSALATR